LKDSDFTQELSFSLYPFSQLQVKSSSFVVMQTVLCGIGEEEQGFVLQRFLIFDVVSLSHENTRNDIKIKT
jgi:hypothetical protein